ncbi:MAG: D-glycero-beta-D-manno-heptose-7-phosphate kinase, partial [Candidatus Omnitrophota bacterium]
VYLCGVIGDDEFGKKLIEIIKRKKINTDLVIKDKLRPTTIKTRVVATHQQVIRVDWESREILSLALNQKILKNVHKVINELDGVIVEDYGKGVINPYLVEELVRISKRNNKVITVDPKEEHFDYYENVTALTPNLKEAQAAVNMKIKSKEEINLLGKILKEKLRPSCVLITLGEEGIRLFLEKEIWHIPTYALEVFDVTGAGDTVIATFTLALLAGASFLEAAVISNLCAGIVVGKFGPATVTLSEIEGKIKTTKIDVEKTEG